jgi:hypothetical protein
MGVWNELRVVLARLNDEQPDALLWHPNPAIDRELAPPFPIQLAPWAVDLAEELHRRFGNDVKLTVGALPYPRERQPEHAIPYATRFPEDLLNPHEIKVELDGPAIVRSGDTIEHGLLVTNLTGQEIQLAATNGHLTATVVNPSTGEVVGGFSGAQAALLTVYRIAAGTMKRIPVLIGTASAMPDIGHTVPPGTWGIQSVLILGADPVNSTHKLTPILPLRVIPRNSA